MIYSETSQEILNLLHELNTTIKSIDSKLDIEVNEVDIDESSGDVHITRKIINHLVGLKPFKKFNTLKDIPNDKSKSESESESEKIIIPITN